MILIIPVAILLFAGFCAYFIGKKVYSQMRKTGRRHAREFRGLVTVLSFLAISFILFALLFMNVVFSRGGGHM